MPLLALVDVRQTTCQPPSPPRALQFGIIPTCQGLFFPPCHSRMPGVERLSQETRVPPCRSGGKCAAWRRKNCGGFGAFTSCIHKIPKFPPRICVSRLNRAKNCVNVANKCVNTLFLVSKLS